MSAATEEWSDLLAYHVSLAAEMNAIKDRVRHLIRHWATDGAFKEAALRMVLRRHLPETLQIGTGFIVNNLSEHSTQIDVLIVDRSHPTLFKDGDLLIVTPSAVRAIIEVKTLISGPKAFEDALDKLAECRRICRTSPMWSHTFAGLFVYESAENQARNIAESAKRIYKARKEWIDAVAYGPNLLGFVQDRSRLSGSERANVQWSLWEVPQLAPAYFISSILNRIQEHDVMFNPATWFPNHPESRMTHWIDQCGNVIDNQGAQQP